MSRFDDLRQSVGIAPIGTSKKKEKPTLQPINLSTREVTPAAPESIAPSPVSPTQMIPLPSFNIAQSPLMKTIQAQPVQTNTVAPLSDTEIKARQLPVIGPVLRGLDIAAQKTEPVANILRSLYTPGSGLANLAGLTGSAGALIGKALPGLGQTIAGKIGKAALTEGIAGAPLGAGQALQMNPNANLGELAKGAALGAAFGGALGGAGAGIAQGLSKVGQNAAANLVRNAIQNVAENARTPVTSPFAGSAAVLNPIAKGYTEQVARTFEPTGGSALDRLRASHVPTAEPVPAVGAPQVAAEVPAIIQRAGVPAQPTVGQQGTRANYQTQLEQGNFSPELQNLIRNTDQTYNVATNRASVEAANEAIKNLPTAESKFLLNESGGAEHIATGYRLMQELDAKGEHARALTIADKLAKDLTKSGQTSQAASIISRLSPEGQFLNLVRTAEKNGMKVSEADAIKFKQLASEVQQKAGAGIHSNQFNEILDRVERGENVSPNELINLANFLSRAEKVVKPKPVSVRQPVVKQPKLPKEVSANELPVELSQPKKRDKVISFFDDAEQAALARIAARKNNLNSLPLPEWRDHAIVVASQLAKGTIKTATHVEDLVKLFGEEIRPVATQVFQSAQSMLKGVSRSAASDNLERAQQTMRKLSGEVEAEKEAVKIMGDHVKKLIADAKSGILNTNDIQKLRDYSDEITDMISKKPARVTSQEERFLQSVKSLAKKIAQVESESVPADQANREISSLIRQVAKISDEGLPIAEKTKLDNKALSDIAHDVMEKTRPNPKPTTLQEKIVEKFLREKESQGKVVSESDIASLRQLAKDTTRLSSDQKIEADMAMQRILNSYEKSTPWEKVNAIRYIAMLLNTGTQAVNAISGPLMASTGYLADILGTMIRPSSTTLYGSNPLRFIAGYLKNAKVGVKAGFQGVNPAGIQGTNEIRGLTYKGKYNPLSWLERGLGAVAKGADYATYKTVFDSELVKQGYLDAKKLGIKGKEDIKKHIERYVNDPPEAAIEQADNIGKNTTFQRSDTLGGQAANYLQGGGPKIQKYVKPVVNSVFPFVRTPVNIASTAVTLTPAGIFKGLYQLTSRSPASQREAIRTLSLGLTGSAGLGPLGYYLNQIGVITGANDTGNKDVNAIREQAGQGKYRFNTSALKRYLGAMLNGEGFEAAEKAAQYQKGDSAFDYNRLQPLAFPVAIGAALSETKGKPMLERLGNAGESAFGSLYGMSSLQGLSNVMQAPLTGSTLGEKAIRFPINVIESFFKSFSPSALAQEARRQDTTVRKTAFGEGPIKDIGDYFKSRAPFFSQTLPPQKTTLGITKQNAPGVMGQYVNPYKSEVAPYSDAAKVISDLIARTGDLTLAPSAPEKKVTGKDRTGKKLSVTIPQDRYAQLQEEVGNEIIKKVLALSPSLTDAKKAEKLKTIYSDAKEKASNKVKKELGVK